MKPCFVIGIAGGTASGKSTLAKALADALLPGNIQSIAMDSYYKPEAQLPLVTTKSGREYRDYNCPDAFDLSHMKDDIHTILYEGVADILIVEGLLTLWDEEICALCNLRVFVDCPADIRVLRRVKHNLTWGLTLEEITDAYLDLVRYRHEEYVAPSVSKADLVVSSEKGIREAVYQIKELVR